MDQYLTVYVLVIFVLTFVFPSYMMARLGYILSPVLSHYFITHKWCNYKKFDKNVFTILFSLFTFSLFFGIFYLKPLLNNFNDFGIIVLIIIQVSLLLIFEFKTPNNILKSFKNICLDLKSFYKTNQIQLFEVESKGIINQRESINELKSLIEKNTNSICYSNETSFQEFKNTIAAQEKKNNTELKEFIEKKAEYILVSSELNFQKLSNEIEEQKREDIEIAIQPRRKQYSDNELSEICEVYKIAQESINDVKLIITGKKVKNRIIFTGVHNKRFRKRLVADFFKNHFFIYTEDEKLGKLKPTNSLEDILNFINSNIQFKSEDKLKNDQILILTSTYLSKK